MIGLDLDGVLSEFCLPFTRIAREVGVWGNSPYSTVMQAMWNFDFNVSPVWKRIDGTLNWWMTLPPLVSPAEVAQINRVIAQQGVAFITTRRTTKGFPVERQSRLWLQSVGIPAGGCPVVTTDDKGATCRDLGVTVMLDDKPKNLHAIANAGVIAVARTWLYNTSYPGPHAASVGDFLERYAGEPLNPTPRLDIRGGGPELRGYMSGG